jgi:hypothetical protein
MAAGRERRAVLVLPDIGLSESQLEHLKGEFQNNLVSTLKRGGVKDDVSVVVVVTVTF